jgi:hypothetical protein
VDGLRATEVTHKVMAGGGVMLGGEAIEAPPPYVLRDNSTGMATTEGRVAMAVRASPLDQGPAVIVHPLPRMGHQAKADLRAQGEGSRQGSSSWRRLRLQNTCSRGWAGSQSIMVGRARWWQRFSIGRRGARVLTHAAPWTCQTTRTSKLQRTGGRGARH